MPFEVTNGEAMPLERATVDPHREPRAHATTKVSSPLNALVWARSLVRCSSITGYARSETSDTPPLSGLRSALDPCAPLEHSVQHVVK